MENIWKLFRISTVDLQCMGIKEIAMKEGIYNILKATLDGDDSLSKEDKNAILAFCKCPKLIPTQSLSIKFLTPNEVVQMFGVSLRTIQRWISSGQLPSQKLGGCRRVPSNAIENFIQAQTLTMGSQRQDMLEKAS